MKKWNKIGYVIEPKLRLIMWELSRDIVDGIGEAGILGVKKSLVWNIILHKNG